MKKILLCVAALALSSTAVAGGPVRVKGYVNSNGTYVAPHYRSAPDGNRYNNYSTQGNINPYTGKVGTQNPYAPPTYSNPYAPKPKSNNIYGF